MYHAVEAEIRISQVFKKNRNSSIFIELYMFKMYHCLLFLIMYILHLNFCAISYNRTQKSVYTKSSGKIVITALPAKVVSMSFNKALNTKFRTIPCNRIRDRTITRVFWENGITAPPTKLYALKSHHCYF